MEISYLNNYKDFFPDILQIYRVYLDFDVSLNKTETKVIIVLSVVSFFCLIRWV